MAKQEQLQPLNFPETRKITGIKKVDSLTNDKYKYVTSPKADEMIEKNNREYAATYARIRLNRY